MTRFLIPLAIFGIIAILITTLVMAETLPVGNHYFASSKCGACTEQTKIVKKLQDEGYDIKIHNYSDDPKIFDELDIRVVPQFIIIKIKNGKEVVLKLKGKQPIRKLVRTLIKNVEVEVEVGKVVVK